MTDSFRDRMPALPDADLQRYVARPLEYRAEAVEAALAELARRGLGPSDETLAEIRRSLLAREADLHLAPAWYDGLLGHDPATRRTRIRRMTLAILAVGFGAAAFVYLTAAPAAGNPLGYDPMDTKKYLRDLEIYGGKVNVLATEFMRWFDGLWHGRSLAYTLAWLTAFTATAFGWITRRRAAELDAAPPPPSRMEPGPLP